MKKFLAVCVFLALTGAAMAISTSFKGTVDVKFDWVNFSDSSNTDTNCDDWVNFVVKYDAYMVLCYEPVVCPVCPFTVSEAYLWLVNKKTSEVFVLTNQSWDLLSGGGIEDLAGYCFGDGNVGVVFTAYLPHLAYVDTNGQVIGTTSVPLRFVLSGMREKYNYKTLADQNIVTLDGSLGGETITDFNVTTPYWLCDDASEAISGAVSFKKQSVNIKPDPYCPGCPVPCDEVVAWTNDKVIKAAKPRLVKGGKYFWLEVQGQDTFGLIW